MSLNHFLFLQGMPYDVCKLPVYALYCVMPSLVPSVMQESEDHEITAKKVEWLKGTTVHMVDVSSSGSSVNMAD